MKLAIGQILVFMYRLPKIYLSPAAVYFRQKPIFFMILSTVFGFL